MDKQERGIIGLQGTTGTAGVTALMDPGILGAPLCTLTAAAGHSHPEQHPCTQVDASNISCASERRG